MSSDNDPSAVVDRLGAVRGVERLRVVDAAILPEIPSIATNVIAIMVAERVASPVAGVASNSIRIDS